MAGRYFLNTSWPELRNEFGESRDLQPHPDPSDPDIRPATLQWVAREENGRAELVQMRWGLVPYAYRGKRLSDLKITNYNVACDQVSSNPRIAGSYERRRCLVPASGWYRWTGRSNETRWMIAVEQTPFLTFAGVWDRVWLSDVGPLESFIVLTSPAPGQLAHLHPRTPAIVPAELRAEWLARSLTAESLDAAQQPLTFALSPTIRPDEGNLAELA